jgi:hypothetical protein
MLGDVRGRTTTQPVPASDPEVPPVPDAPLPGSDPAPSVTAPPPSGVVDPAGVGVEAGTVAAHHAKAHRRPADTIWRANPREQGLIGLTDAIAYFGGIGWSVSMPLIDSQPYDLVVDDGHRLLRVQVKTTTRRSSGGRYLVQLCTRGGNQSFHTTKYFDPDASDLLYVLTDDRTRYVIPTSAIRARSVLTLNGRFDTHCV